MEHQAASSDAPPPSPSPNPPSISSRPGAISGDNPNRINRDLQMMAYVSQAQAKLLESLRQNLASIETNQQATQNAKDELEEIADEQRQQKATQGPDQPAA